MVGRSSAEEETGAAAAVADGLPLPGAGPPARRLASLYSARLPTFGRPASSSHITPQHYLQKCF